MLPLSKSFYEGMPDISCVCRDCVTLSGASTASPFGPFEAGADPAARTRQAAEGKAVYAKLAPVQYGEGVTMLTPAPEQESAVRLNPNVELRPRAPDEIGVLYEAEAYDIFINGREIGEVGMNRFFTVLKKYRASVDLGPEVSEDVRIRYLSGEGDTPAEAVADAFETNWRDMNLAIKEMARLAPAVIGRTLNAISDSDSEPPAPRTNRLRFARTR